jgi:hypothetical protein
MADPIRRRDDEDVERELRVDHKNAPPHDPDPGGAEGGDESPSADLPMGLPADDQAHTGDTDQHSDPHKLPSHRERARRRRP